MTQTIKASAGFTELELPAPLLQAIDSLGYESPTAIQSATIPPLLSGVDVLGHAPTGTGKTAAFALPVLALLKPGKKGVQALVLAPTRELAIQVAEAFSQYAMHMPNVRVLPIYGGQEYGRQIKQLRQGVDIVVGTPGRVMDHMRRGTLVLSSLETLVLDEADEMLRMGFIDDVKWILEQSPPSRRMALFSATMPKEVKRIANQHMTNPTEVSIAKRTMSAETIRQRYWSVSGFHKLETLTRILEAEVFDGMIIFVRTKNATTEVAERLQARGYRAAAMNGDMAQNQREQTVNMLKNNRLDILVATDVVARGLDVNRVSHVVNYDVPYDAEAYVHRIGRTGRAGRQGDAILFITPREQRMLDILERATGQKIEKLVLPTTKMINDRRVADFKQRVADTLMAGDLAYLQQLVEELVQEHNVPAARVAAALAKQMLGDTELLLDESRDSVRHSNQRDNKRSDTNQARDSNRANGHLRDERRPRQSGRDNERQAHERSFDEKRPRRPRPEDNGIQMESFTVDVGASHGVQASNLVGAIANEAGIDSQFIGRITISDDNSTVDLPTGMPKDVLKDLKNVWVCNRKLNMRRADHASSANANTDNLNHGDANTGSLNTDSAYSAGSLTNAQKPAKRPKRLDKPRHKKKVGGHKRRSFGQSHPATQSNTSSGAKAPSPKAKTKQKDKGKRRQKSEMA
jgi:ATP-dependent RNA helicase DeaD